MPCYFTGPKMFWAGPNFLCQTKEIFTYCGSHNRFVPDKKRFVKFLDWLKIFGPAQKHLGPVKGQGMSNY